MSRPFHFNFLRSRGATSVALAALLSVGLAACGGHAATSPLPAQQVMNPSLPGGNPDAGAAGKIKHIVVIIQENRSFDNIFHGFKGANYATSGKDSAGKTVNLTAVSFADNFELCHDYADAIADIHGGKMDGFDHCVKSGPNKFKAYTYVKPAETAKYFTMAKQYGMSDAFYSSQLDASYEGHQYLIAGYSGNTINIPNGTPWGCDAPQGTVIQVVDSHGNPTKKVPPCFTYTTIAKEFDAKGLTWRYYAPSSGNGAYIWSAYDAINYIRNGGDWSKYVISPQCQVLSDAASGNLPAVTWVVPDLPDSDHPLSLSTTGPGWVTAIVNAIGKSSAWNTTAIFVLWDDWGGFYDHVVPPAVDFDGEGMRVPFIAISPYSKVGGISHGPATGFYEFASVLKSIEGLFGVSAMSARDKNTNVKALFQDTTLFDFSQSPRAFKTLGNTGYACNSAIQGPPDTDFGGLPTQQ